MDKVYIFTSDTAADRFEDFDRHFFDTDDAISVPMPLSSCYIPESLSKIEFMKAAVSWEKKYKCREGCCEHYYKDWVKFGDNLKAAEDRGKKIIVVHGQEADSMLLLYSVSAWLKGDMYHLDLTPEGFAPGGLRETNNENRVDLLRDDETVRQYDPAVFDAEDLGITDRIPELIGTEKLATPEERKAWREIWNHWGGEDAGDFPILVDQHGELFHPYSTYLNTSIFNNTPKDVPITVLELHNAVMRDHPQVYELVVLDRIRAMIEQRQIKLVKKSEVFIDWEVIQYKTDIASRWNYFQDLDYLQHFAQYAGKKITLSKEDIEAENERENQDCRDLWGKGHLYHEEKKRSREERDLRMLIKWAGAFNDDWGWYHLMEVMVTKIEMMVEYMRNWSPFASGPVRADQMQRAIDLMKVCIDWGGQYDYKHEEDEDNYFDSEHFIHYVNTRNANRFPSPDYDGHNFWCEAQRIRFDKAWNILWEMFRTKMLTWED